jgi:CBS domain-containing protein
MPLIDAARLLCLNQKGIIITLLRFEKLAALEPQNATIYKACSDAFSVLQNSELKKFFKVTPVEGIWT